MCEIVPTTPDTLMHSGYYLAPDGSLRCTLRLFAQAALGLSQRFLLGTEEARVGDVIRRIPGAECGEGSQPNIDAHLLTRGGQRYRLPLTRYGHVPFTRATPTHTHGLRSALDRAVQHDFDGSYFGQVKRIAYQPTARWGLGVGKAVVATLASEAGIAWLLLLTHLGCIGCIDTPKECLESQINPECDILQHLTMYLTEGGACSLESGQSSVLVIQGDGSLGSLGLLSLLPLSSLFPGVLTNFKEVVVKPAAFLKHVTQLGSLPTSGVEPVEESLTHRQIMAQRQAYSNPAMK